MQATLDRPSAIELDQLAGLLAEVPMDRAELIAALRRIKKGLTEHAGELDRTDGLLEESEKAARMSLAREDDRLRMEVDLLLDDVDGVRLAATSGTDEEELRARGATLLGALRGHRDAEASLMIESMDTDVGAGD